MINHKVEPDVLFLWSVYNNASLMILWSVYNNASLMILWSVYNNASLMKGGHCTLGEVPGLGGVNLIAFHAVASSYDATPRGSHSTHLILYPKGAFYHRIEGVILFYNRVITH